MFRAEHFRRSAHFCKMFRAEHFPGPVRLFTSENVPRGTFPATLRPRQNVPRGTFSAADLRNVPCAERAPMWSYTGNPLHVARVRGWTARKAALPPRPAGM